MAKAKKAVKRVASKAKRVVRKKVTVAPVAYASHQDYDPA